MDTITHGLFGLAIYASIDKEGMSKELKNSLLFASIAGSQIPDVDVISKAWDTQGMYQMWHRGLTHSIFFVPVWAALLSVFCFFIWKLKDIQIFYISALAVFIHGLSDLFNAWGTGYFEPFSAMRITFGTIPIVDFLVWFILLVGFLFARWTSRPTYLVYRAAGLLILAHFLIQSAQGYWIYQSVKEDYDQHTLSAAFIPWHFHIIGKKDNRVEISEATIWREPALIHELTSAEEADLETLFAQNPKAKTLYEWAPLVVIVEDDQKIGLYDPRFYRDGQSFLFEYIEK